MAGALFQPTMFRFLPLFRQAVLFFKQVLLSVSPMDCQDSQGSNEHYLFVEYVLRVHCRMFDNVVAITSSNKAFSRIIWPISLVPIDIAKHDDEGPPDRP